MICGCVKHGLYIAQNDGDCPKCAEEEARNPEPPHTTVVAGQDFAKHRDFATYVSLQIQDKVATV